ncbi:MAG TPA: MFS transporter [Thiobacillaceae bacterium]|nr:MFS transporter [Thiobacillaceae bacterium]
MSSQSRLLHNRRFLPLFLTQFLGAFNDNTFKSALVVLLTFQASSWTSMAPGVLANLAAGVFILPFFLFSATAGQLADKYDKARLARLVKVLEIGIMLVAGLGFVLASLGWLFFALFLLGLHSTLFGPIKYALLPQHLRADELLGGNALVEAGTFVAILLGTIAGGLLAGMGRPATIAEVGGVIAVAGYLASRAIPPAPPPAPGLKIHPNPLSETWRNIGFARENRAVFLSILGISWFWLFGALFLAQFPAYAKTVLGGSESAVTLLLATFTIGVGLGSLACERLSGRQVELGLVPFGSIGLTAFALDLALASPHAMPAAAPLGLSALLGQAGTWHILVDLALIGLFGGFFIVPLYALMQMRSHVDHRARIIAANNIMNALFMVVGSLLAAALLDVGLSIAALFGVAALVNAVVAIYIYRLVPEFLVRFVVWLVLHTVGRVDAQGVQEIPSDGPALLVLDTDGDARPLDVFMIMAACKRPIRFIVEQRLAQSALSGFVLRAAKAIFFRPGEAPDAVQAGRAALLAGQLLAVAHNPVAPGALPGALKVPTFRLTLRRTATGTQRHLWARSELRVTAMSTDQTASPRENAGQC